MKSLRLAALGGVIAVYGFAGWASAPEVSLVPEARPGSEVAAKRRPVERPQSESAVQAEPEVTDEPDTAVEVQVARARPSRVPTKGGSPVRRCTARQPTAYRSDAQVAAPPAQSSGAM